MKTIRLFGVVFFFAFCLSACCNDAYMQEILEDSTMHEQGLRAANEQESLVYVYLDYNRALNNTMSFGGHYWDKTLSELAFAVLLGALFVIWILVRRVHFLYRFYDGNAGMLLNTACAVSATMSVMTVLDWELKTFWFIPVLVALIGVGLSLLPFYFPYHSAWLTSRIWKYVRYLYLTLFGIFVVLCLLSAEVQAPSVY